MSAFKSSAGRPAYYSIREAAWILGVTPSDLCCAIHLGTLHAVWRNGRLLIPADALTTLLGEPADSDPQSRGTP